MAPDVAEVLARLGRREHGGRRPGVRGRGEGGYLDGRSLCRRYDAAIKRGALRRLRFHDLRHTFATSMIAVADIRRVEEWMGQADIQTTMRYLHSAPRAEDAALVAKAFCRSDPTPAQL
jgi:integrase